MHLFAVFALKPLSLKLFKEAMIQAKTRDNYRKNKVKIKTNIKCKSSIIERISRKLCWVINQSDTYRSYINGLFVKTETLTKNILKITLTDQQPQ